MRVMVVEPGAAFSVQDVHNGAVKGLRANGCEVFDFNLGHRLDFYANAKLKVKGRYRQAFDRDGSCHVALEGIYAEAFKFWPDVVIIVSSFFIPPFTFKLLRARRMHIVLWFTESPYEDDRQLMQVSEADTVVVNDPTNIDEYLAINPRTIYLPHSYDPDIHHPGTTAPDIDFSFIGTGYESRIEFFEAMNWDGIDPVFAGNWMHVKDESPLMPYLLHERGQCVDNTDTADLYRRSKMSANIYRKEAAEDYRVPGWAMGPREVELAACNTFFAREPRGEGDELFHMLPTFTEPGELEELIRWWLPRDEQRAKAAAHAAEAAADRTFAAHTAQLLRYINTP